MKVAWQGLNVNWSEVRYFKKDEWREDPNKVSSLLVRVLDEVREKADVPIVIHQAYSKSGHSEHSYHYKGMAVDFHFTKGDFREHFELLCELEEIGAIGWYPFWNHPGWHIDVREVERRVYWYRNSSGSYVYGLESLRNELKLI